MRSDVLILMAVFLVLVAIACGPESSSGDDGICEIDSDCEEGYICFNKSCVQGSWNGDDNGYQGGECDIAADCGDGYYCEDHFCYPITENNPDGDDGSDGDNAETDGDDISEIDEENQTDGDEEDTPEVDIDPEPEVEPEPEPEPDPEIPDIPRTQQCYEFPSYANLLPEPGLMDSCTLFGTSCPQVAFQVQIPDNGGQGDVNMVHFDWRLVSGIDTVDDKEIQIQAPGMSSMVVWNQYNQTDMPLELVDFWDKTRGIGTWNVVIIDKGWTFGSSGTMFNRVCLTLVDPAQTAGIDWDSEQIACSTFASTNFSTCSDSPCTKSETLEITDFATANRYPEINLDVSFAAESKLTGVEVRLYAPRHGEAVVLWEQSGDVTAIPGDFVAYELMDTWAKGSWKITIEYASKTGTVTWNNFCVRVNEEEIPESDGDEEDEFEAEADN